ncbi:hypothetical protein J6TS1_25540 [Siminovitchia terrae]|uniref:Uncharacterized protein n=1 Tax=Siminovitchia terrae TaxID=1914933 RepID=A0ABQ4KYF5_SIMTE|nr:hypothetical protein [Siminovitchia terrae]GIN96684.1 hypothetical protein J6TS1_25540 [Siminovitchia terrae]
MRQRLWIICLMIPLALLSACSGGNQNNQDAEEKDIPEILEVKLESS